MRLISVGILAAAIAMSACDRAQVSGAVEGDSASATTAVSAASGVREITIPAGTHLPITLDTTVGSDISHVEESVAAHLTTPIVVHGQTVLAAGSRVSGSVIDATRSGRVNGRAHVAIRFDSVSPAGPAESGRYRIETAAVGRTAESTKKKDAMMIGAPAAGGALIGGLAGGGKGALIGAAVGGGAGTAVVLSTRGDEVRLTKGSALTLRLSEPLTVKVRS
jgi:hypothetical protein